MKLIILNGGSCSGKSTIIENIMKRKNDLFHLSYDYLKWQFSNYDPREHRKDVQKIVLAVATCIFKIKCDVIFDSALYKNKIEREKVIDLAKKANYEIIEINLEADFEILLKRFDQRVVIALIDTNIKRANLSKDKFKEIFDTYNKEKNPSAITFRTDKQSIEEISKNIIKLLE